MAQTANVSDIFVPYNILVRVMTDYGHSLSAPMRPGGVIRTALGQTKQTTSLGKETLQNNLLPTDLYGQRGTSRPELCQSLCAGSRKDLVQLTTTC